MSTVYIYFEPIKLEVVILRSRDMRYWRSESNVSPKVIGAAVKKGIQPTANEIRHWQPYTGLALFTDPSWQCVVVERKDRKMRVLTPFYNWGKAPDIELGRWPLDLALGEAVASQAMFSANKALANTVEGPEATANG